MNTERIKNSVVRGMKAIDNWLADRLNYSGIEKREQRVYDRWRDEYEQFTDRELSSRYVNLKRKLRHNKQFTYPLLMLLTVGTFIGFTGLLAYALLKLAVMYYAGVFADMGSPLEYAKAIAFLLVSLYAFALCLVVLIQCSYRSSFNFLQTRLLVIEEIRADRRRNEVRCHED